MEHGGNAGHLVSLGSDMLCNVSDQRHIRIHKLAENEKETAAKLIGTKKLSLAIFPRQKLCFQNHYQLNPHAFLTSVKG